MGWYKSFNQEQNAR